RGIEKKVVLATLAGIAVITALVIVAWRYGGTGTPTATTTAQKAAAPPPVRLQFVGRGTGTYLEIRRNSATGRVLFQGTLRRGDTEFLVGKRFWLSVRRPVGVRFKLGGKPLSLPARRNLKVVVTPTKTARAGT